ncbi:riboflavin synthase [Trichothermofontia sp.]
MFTGLVQAIGTLERFGSDQLQIACWPPGREKILGDLAIGDSVAVDGVCLTVVDILPTGFRATASPETLRRTTLGEQTAPVNLETALRVGSKLGGHFVTGHVDGVGVLRSAQATGRAWEMSFEAPAAVARYILPKGSIAVNGISLTVATCDPVGTHFQVAVIPQTYQETTLRFLQPGDRVNLEGDVLGKYVEKFLVFGGPTAADAALATVRPMEPPPPLSDITDAFLQEHGYG